MLLSTPAEAVGQLVSTREEPRIMTQWGVRNQDPKLKAGPRDLLRVDESTWKGAGKTHVGDGRGRVTWSCQHPCLLAVSLSHSAFGPRLGPRPGPDRD